MNEWASAFVAKAKNPTVLFLLDEEADETASSLP
jgi:hypothetical protein